MDEEQVENMKKSETSWVDLPPELREMILENCEMESLIKMAISAPNMSRWILPNSIQSIILKKINDKVCMRIWLAMGRSFKYLKGHLPFGDQLYFKVEFQKLENPLKTQVEWIITRNNNRKTRTKYVIEKNYKDAALLEFHRFLKFSQNYVKTLSIEWPYFNHQTIDPKKYKNLTFFEIRSTYFWEAIGYGFEEVFSWKIRCIGIITNHWNSQDLRKICTNWLGKTEEKDLAFGRKRFRFSEWNFWKLDRNEIINGFVQNEELTEMIRDFKWLDEPYCDDKASNWYVFPHPIFPHFFLSVSFQVMPQYKWYQTVIAAHKLIPSPR